MHSVDVTGSKKNAALEAARGIAAVVVVLHHFFLGFAPKYTGYLEVDRTPKSVAGEWYFAIFNGTGAVFFFFVLSGYVLSKSYLSKGDVGILVTGALKRLPRLAVPVILSLCFAVVLIKLGTYSFQEAARVTGSTWLQTAGYANTPLGDLATLPDAIRQGLTTYFTGEAYYNSNIWTMHPEYLGSLVVFSILPMLAFSRSSWVLLVLTGLLVAIGYSAYGYVVPFVLGAGLSVLLHRRRIALPLAAGVVLLALGLYLLGYVASIRSYAWLAWADPLFQGQSGPSLVYNSAGAVLVIVALVGCSGISQGLSGSVGYLLGKLSFPIYLSHLPILMSLSGSTLLWALHSGAKGWTALHITLAVTLLAVLVVSAPFAVIDAYWVKWVNRVASRLNPSDGSVKPREVKAPAEPSQAAPAEMRRQS